MKKNCKHNWKYAESRIDKREGMRYNYIVYVFYCTKCGELKQNKELSMEEKKKKHWWQ